MGSAWCPRCGVDLLKPSVYDSAWRCETHGPVLPFVVLHGLDADTVVHLRRYSEVPMWLPDHPGLGWELDGVAVVGDARSRIRATVTSYSGPAPLGGRGEWLVVAEEPGIGLGAGYAGSVIESADAWTRTSSVRVHTDGHPTHLWAVADSAEDRSAYVGESQGVWIWVVGFPSDAGYALIDDLTLVDARDAHTEVTVSRLGMSGDGVHRRHRAPGTRLRPR